MDRRYSHTQTGLLMIYLFLGMLVLIMLSNPLKCCNPPLLLIILILGACLALFYQLTVTIDGDFLKISFGIGVIKKRFPLKDIAGCRRVKNAWHYGWGIHLTPHGWLYNVSGFDAVEVVTKAGRKYRIGTDVPQELEQAIRSTISTKL